jgi:uncharacterized membrane protein
VAIAATRVAFAGSPATLLGSYSVASGINDAGQVVEYAIMPVRACWLSRAPGCAPQERRLLGEDVGRAVRLNHAGRRRAQCAHDDLNFGLGDAEPHQVRRGGAESAVRAARALCGAVGSPTTP